MKTNPQMIDEMRRAVGNISFNAQFAESMLLDNSEMSDGSGKVSQQFKIAASALQLPFIQINSALEKICGNMNYEDFKKLADDFTPSADNAKPTWRNMVNGHAV